MCVERASNGIALLDDLRLTTRLPIVELKPTDSKEARAAAVSPLFESGRVKFPRHARWLDDVMNEFLRFPHGRHDDAVDAIVWALIHLQTWIVRVETDRRIRATVDAHDGWFHR